MERVISSEKNILTTHCSCHSRAQHLTSRHSCNSRPQATLSREAGYACKQMNAWPEGINSQQSTTTHLWGFVPRPKSSRRRTVVDVVGKMCGFCLERTVKVKRGKTDSVQERGDAPWFGSGGGDAPCAADPPPEAKKRLFFEEYSMCMKHRNYRQKWPLGRLCCGQGAESKKELNTREFFVFFAISW